jgi:lipoic acid synthetase
MRDLDLVTVCEEAGCPNTSECWADGTATFMINGERCTRACGFCLVDTRHPEPLAADEPERVAEAVARMGLGHAVVTAVARDDLDDGGAGAFAATVAAIRRRTPGCAVEVLISDCKGDPGVAPAGLRRPARRREPQPRDGPQAPAGGATRRPRTPARSRCSPAPPRRA